MIAASAVLMPAAAAAGQMPPNVAGGNPVAPPQAVPLPKGQVVQLTVSPKALQRPVLRNSLITRVEDRQPGNAATYYEAAAMEVTEIRLPEDYAKIEDEVRNKALSELTQADYDKVAKAFPFKPYWTALGARRPHAEWPFEQDEGITALLPSLGTYRKIANRLNIDARWDVHEKRYADAVDKIRIGVTLGRHMGEGTTLIEGLVGVSISATSLKTINDLVQQPDAPNLYWSLSQLPQPMIQLPWANERGWVYFSLPEFQKVRKGTFTDGDWDSLMGRLRNPMGFVNMGMPMEGYEGPEWSGKVALTALNMRAYPRARAYLKENGRSNAELEAMGPKKILATYYVETFETWMDEATKGAALPYREAHQIKGDWGKEMAASPDYRMNPMLLMIPALSQVSLATAKLDRSVALLRIVEALRMYAAGHEGQWPKELEDCDVPIPEDPVMGKAFIYEIEDGKAVIESMGPNMQSSVRYELMLRK
jgi:hypothetical protein